MARNERLEVKEDTATRDWAADIPRMDRRTSDYLWRSTTAISQRQCGLSLPQSEDQPHVEKWSLGILNDRYTEEVPGTVLLLTSNRNEPLGVEHEAARHSGSSMPNQGWASRAPSRRPSSAAEKKKTADGKIVLEPQPEDSANDPLNWPAWRRDCALLSLGLYCMIGGGMTPILAAGFNNVAQAFDVTYEKVALTTGLVHDGSWALASVIQLTDCYIVRQKARLSVSQPSCSWQLPFGVLLHQATAVLRLLECFKVLQPVLLSACLQPRLLRYSFSMSEPSALASTPSCS